MQSLAVHLNSPLLEELADHGEYEIRRRITKALPKLILRNIELSLKLMSNLRVDYMELSEETKFGCI